MKCSNCHNHYNSIIQDTIRSEGVKYNAHICPRCDNIDYVPITKKPKSIGYVKLFNIIEI